MDGLIEDARSRVRGPEILRFSSALFSRALVPARARCYHIYSSRATIFYFSDTVHFSARSLSDEMPRWAVLSDHYFVGGLLYSLMSGLSLRTFSFEDWCCHLVIYRAVIDAQIYISTFSLDRCWFKWIITCLGLGSYYLVLWLSLLLYSFLSHVLAFRVMIWRSYKYVDLDVMILCIDVPTQTWKFLIHTHWFYPP